jgi:hypothetical protein
VREAYRLDAAYLACERPAEEGVQAPWEPPHRDGLLSRWLVMLLERDERFSAATGEVGVLDGDPFLDAQEFQEGALSDLAVEVVTEGRDRAEVRARFTNFGPVEVGFDLVREGGRWVIDDIRAGSRSLRAALSRPYPCGNGWSEPGCATVDPAGSGSR